MAPEVIQNSDGYNEKVLANLLNLLLHIELCKISFCLDAGGYLVFRYNCYRNGKRWTPLGRYSPHESSFHDTSWKSSSGHLSTFNNYYQVLYCSLSKHLLCTFCEKISIIFINMQLDDHFSKPIKEFVSLCLRKNPAEVKFLPCGSICTRKHFLCTCSMQKFQIHKKLLSVLTFLCSFEHMQCHSSF